jgi:hypothetical protein
MNITQNINAHYFKMYKNIRFGEASAPCSQLQGFFCLLFLIFRFGIGYSKQE